MHSTVDSLEGIITLALGLEMDLLSDPSLVSSETTKVKLKTHREKKKKT